MSKFNCYIAENLGYNLAVFSAEECTEFFGEEFLNTEAPQELVDRWTALNKELRDVEAELRKYITE